MKFIDVYKRQMQDLMIEWKDDKSHLYEQIYSYIKEEIRKGKLLYREKLPSTRSLAQYLQVLSLIHI